MSQACLLEVLLVGGPEAELVKAGDRDPQDQAGLVGSAPIHRQGSGVPERPGHNS